MITIFVLCSLFFSFPVKAEKYRFFQAMQSQAVFVGNNDAPLATNHAWGVDARIGWYSDEQNASFSDSLFRYPTFGAGLFYGNLQGINLGEDGHYADMGCDVALYGFFQAPIIRSRKSQFDWLTGFGVSGGHGTWHSETNPNNTITGTFLNYFILLGAEYRYSFTNTSSLGLAVNLRHSSNAGFRKPNRGLNLVGVDLTYRFDESGNFNKRYTPLQNIDFPRKWDWSLSVGYGLQQLDKSNRLPLFDKPEYHFSNVTLATRVMRQCAAKRKFGVGLDFLYSEAGSYLEQVYYHPKGIPTARPKQYHLSQQLNAALVLSHEYGYNRLWLITDVGFYLKPFNGYLTQKKTRYYERVGVKYRFSQRYYAAVCVRAYRVAAIHAEWTLGMYLKK